MNSYHSHRSHRFVQLSALFLTALAEIYQTASAQPGLAERVRALNNNLLQLHGRAQDAPASSIADLRRQAAGVMQERSAALEALMRQNSADARALAFSRGTLGGVGER